MNYQTTRYTYDRLGNRTSKRDVLAEQAGADLDEIYTYDQQNQLIDLDRIGNHEHFHYDTTGNWLAYQRNGTLQTRTHNTANEIVSVDGSDTSLRTDAVGNMTRIPNPKAVPGPTVAQNLNLTYDAWNRLVRVSTPDGSEVISCSYDGLNRRVRKTTASETREYYYNKNWQCLEEYLYGTLQNSYLWGLRYLDDLICFTPDYTIALTDANFNVVAVANQSGLTERYTYTAFGQRTILTPSYAPRSESVYPALTRTFTSQVLDYETGLMLYRNRCYAPTLGRFIVRDPIGNKGDSTNIYRYVMNTPLILQDSSGMVWHIAGGCLAGGILSGIGAWFVGGNVKCAALGGCITGTVIAAFPTIQGGCIGGAIGGLVNAICTSGGNLRKCANFCDAMIGMITTLFGCLGGSAVDLKDPRIKFIISGLGFDLGIIYGFCDVLK